MATPIWAVMTVLCTSHLQAGLESSGSRVGAFGFKFRVQGSGFRA